MADLALVAVMAIWGSSFAVIRFFVAGGASSPAPLSLLTARMALASALLALFLAASAKGRAQLRELLSPRGLLQRGSLARDGLLLGVLLAGGFLLQSEGLSRTTASRSGFFTGLLVMFTPLLEFAFFRKRPSAAQLAGVLLAFSGMALLSGPLTAGGVSTATGDALTVGCAAVFTLHILLLGRVASRHDVAPLLLAQLLTTAVIGALCGPLVEVPRLGGGAQLWAAIVYLALLATLLCFGVQTWAQRKIAPVRIALLSSLEPVFAALWAALLIGERLQGREKAGGALIVLGVLVGEAGAALLAARARKGERSSPRGQG